MRDPSLTMAGFYTLAVLLFLSIILVYIQPKLWHRIFVAFPGLLTGNLDMNSHEVQSAVLLLLAFGFFSGFFDSRRPWRWALLLAVWIPLFAFVRILAEHSYGTLIPRGFGSLLAFLPALAGVYLGVGIRRASERNS